MDSHLGNFDLLFVLLISEFLEMYGSLSPLFFLHLFLKKEDNPLLVHAEFWNGIFIGVDLSWMDGFTLEILGCVVSGDCLTKVDVNTRSR
jgi:hypothetical protein